jgi:LDH2 family malate/lactate/ureidoglycolate dehydrogenase
MSKESCYIPVDTLRSFIRDVLLKTEVPSVDAEICADVIIESDKRGIESHGIGRLKYYYDRIKAGQHKVVTDFEIIKQGPTTAVIDGHHGMGMVIAKRSMQMAIDKAKEYGMGSVAVRNSTHFGIAGYYPLMAIQQNMIGFTVTNARPSVSPTFGVQAMLGTNPIAFGAPSDEEIPFLYDGATPITQRGKIEVYNRAEKPLPEGWVIDDKGQAMTNSKQTLEALEKKTASFLPLGGAGELLAGYKGYGLGTMVEILSASLQTGVFLQALSGVGADGSPQPFRVGHFFMAINIESFTTLPEFKGITGQILRDLRNSKKVPGQKRIYTAGEKEFEMLKVTRERGIEVNQNLQKEMKYLIEALKINNYNFPF